MRLSLVIPAKDPNDSKLKELLRSIEMQDFPKSEVETLVITEGTSESAKAIGIRKARGEVIGFLASDNQIPQCFLSIMYKVASENGAAQPAQYRHEKSDDILNRYFALIGGNDPLSYYMAKNDKQPHRIKTYDKAICNMTIGDNGFFIQKKLIEKTDLDNYYHIDNALEAIVKPNKIGFVNTTIWHKTGGNIFKFFQKRYLYGLQHAFNKNRRWHLVDFKQPRDIGRLIWFIVASLTVVHPLLTSAKGYRKIQDVAWLLHPVVCIMTVFVYGLLTLHVLFNKLFQSSSVPTVAQRA